MTDRPFTDEEMAEISAKAKAVADSLREERKPLPAGWQRLNLCCPWGASLGRGAYPRTDHLGSVAHFQQWASDRPWFGQLGASVRPAVPEGLVYIPITDIGDGTEAVMIKTIEPPA